MTTSSDTTVKLARPLTRMNWSTLKHLAVSPKNLKWRMEHELEETPSLILGRAIHCAILEPEQFEKRWIVAGKCEGIVKTTSAPCGSQGSQFLDGHWYCRVKGHAPAGAGPLPDGIEVIAETDLERVRACTAAVAEHRVASKILKGGLVEHAVEWTNPETGIACRGRLDYLKPDGVVDLKSGFGETLWDIERTITQKLYYAQVAWYHDGAIGADRLQPDAPLPIIVHVSTTEPYDVACFRLSKATYEAGRILYRDLLKTFQACLGSDLWPGIAPRLIELELKDWAKGMNGSEYGGDWA